MSTQHCSINGIGNYSFAYEIYISDKVIWVSEREPRAIRECNSMSWRTSLLGPITQSALDPDI